MTFELPTRNRRFALWHQRWTLGAGIVLLVLPAIHPVLRPALGPPSHLLWFAHVFPVALAAYLWGQRGLWVAVSASVLWVMSGELMFGAGYGVPADRATVAALGVSVGATGMLVGWFALWVRASERGQDRLYRLASTALDATGIPVLLVDGNRTLRYANRAAQELLGRRDLLDVPVGEVLGDAPELLHALAHGEAGRWSAILHVGERVYPIEVSATVVPSERQERRWVVTLRDRTDEVRRSEEERRATALQELGAVIAGVAHELNNPLTSVAAYAELLEEHLPGLEPDIRQAVEALVQEGKQAAQIARRLLTRVRRAESGRTSLDINAVVQRALRSRARQLAAHQIQVQVRLAGGALPGYGSESELEQVIANLLVNAEHAMYKARGCGRLTVTTSEIPQGVAVVVEDDGPGIPREILPRIFDPFFSTKGDEGNGLGLAIARRIARSHGGDLVAENCPGGGARFTLTLPGRSAIHDAVPVVEDRATRRTRPLRGVRVLLVDDQLEIRRSVGRLLERQGVTVTAVATVAEALDELSADRFDVLLCDAHLVESSGFELYERLRARGHPLLSRFVLMSGDVLAPEVNRFLSETGCAHLPKPFEARDIYRIVGEVAA